MLSSPAEFGKAVIGVPLPGQIVLMDSPATLHRMPKPRGQLKDTHGATASAAQIIASRRASLHQITLICAVYAAECNPGLPFFLMGKYSGWVYLNPVWIQ